MFKKDKVILPHGSSHILLILCLLVFCTALILGAFNSGSSIAWFDHHPLEDPHSFAFDEDGLVFAFAAFTTFGIAVDRIRSARQSFCSLSPSPTLPPPK